MAEDVWLRAGVRRWVQDLFCTSSKPPQGPPSAALGWWVLWALPPAESEDPGLMRQEEEALHMQQVIQLLFSSSACSSSALVMGISGYTVLQSPCIDWSLLHTSLICPLCDLGHTTDTLLDVTFYISIWTARFMSFSNVCWWFHGQNTIFFLLVLSQEWCQWAAQGICLRASF